MLLALFILVFDVFPCCLQFPYERNPAKTIWLGLGNDSGFLHSFFLYLLYLRNIDCQKKNQKATLYYNGTYNQYNSGNSDSHLCLVLVHCSPVNDGALKLSHSRIIYILASALIIRKWYCFNLFYLFFLFSYLFRMKMIKNELPCTFKLPGLFFWDAATYRK